MPTSAQSPLAWTDPRRARRRFCRCPAQHPTEEAVIETRPSAEKKPFVIQTGVEEETVHGRSAAVDAAKTLSRKTPRTVRLERADGRVTMEFRRGNLQTYQYETHGRRRS